MPCLILSVTSIIFAMLICIVWILNDKSLKDNHSERFIVPSTVYDDVYYVVENRVCKYTCKISEVDRRRTWFYVGSSEVLSQELITELDDALLKSGLLSASDRRT